MQVEDSTHSLRGDENPYLVSKSIFLKRGIPVQEVTIEKMNAPDRDLAYILSDVSIATYAKLGGTPWLLDASPTISHELVIGLGSYHLTESRIGSHERVVGITTVFTGDGRYLLDTRTQAVPYEDYSRALLSTLREAVSTVRKEQNWRPADSVRLVFHAFKPFRDNEVQAVQEVLRNLELPQVEYAFLHVADSHPFLLFDEQNPGAWFSREAKKGVLAPERGTMVALSRHESLLTFTGSRDVKLPTHGLPRPMLLRLHRDSTFRDMTYLTRQAFSFSYNGWRAFSPAPKPVTIGYSELIARLIRNLNDVSDWDRDAMLGRIGRTLWFL